jgi:hypothetical protein
MIKIVNTISWVAAIGIAASLAIVMPAFAQTAPATQGGWAGHEGSRGSMAGGMEPGVFGTVSAVSGNTLTVTSVMRQRSNTTTTPTAAPIVYSVDATNAQVYKGSATTTVSVSNIAVGDTVMVQGTVSGTNVVATVIRDGLARPAEGSAMPGSGRKFGQNGSSTPSGTAAIQGNGEPVVGGNVTAISGTTLTVTNASNVTYSIDAASTTVVKNGTSTAVSNIAVGDALIVQGTVNGNSVTASSIIDQGVKNTNASSTSGQSHGGGFGFGAIGGFFGAIGGFFQHLFGF